jgi:hypothetical protein
MSARENFCRRRAGVTQPGRNALAQLLTFLANDNSGSAGEFRRPGRGGFVGPANGGGNEAGVGGEIAVEPYVD